jgi:hypothetical protein
MTEALGGKNHPCGQAIREKEDQPEQMSKNCGMRIIESLPAFVFWAPADRLRAGSGFRRTIFQLVSAPLETRAPRIELRVVGWNVGPAPATVDVRLDQAAGQGETGAPCGRGLEDWDGTSGLGRCLANEKKE